MLDLLTVQTITVLQLIPAVIAILVDCWSYSSSKLNNVFTLLLFAF